MLAGRHDLEGNQALQGDLARFVDHAHAAAPEDAENLVAGNRRQRRYFWSGVGVGEGDGASLRRRELARRLRSPVAARGFRGGVVRRGGRGRSRIEGVRVMRRRFVHGWRPNVISRDGSGNSGSR
jgi:hypothetical protein